MEKFRNAIREELENKDSFNAFQNASESFFSSLRLAFDRFPDTAKLAAEVRKIKENSLENLEYLIDVATQNLERNGIDVFFAKDALDARRYILEELSGVKERTIVKSKSMTLKEIGLRYFLEKEGFEVWETDLGDFLVQLANDEPMHLTAPAIHLSKENIAKLVEKFGELKNRDANSIVRLIADFLREKIEKAEVGFTGANAIAANSGSLLIIENEGNARLVSSLPELHIAVVGVEKIVPSLQDAYKVAEVTWRYAGYEMPSYIDVISSPSKTGDIEKKLVKGAHGPERISVVLLDNGRTAAKGLLREALKCLRCGACLFACPVFGELRGRWGDTYMGGIGVAWDAIINSGEAYKAHALACLLCSRCAEVCPVGIDSGRILRELRASFIRELLGIDRGIKRGNHKF